MGKARRRLLLVIGLALLSGAGVLAWWLSFPQAAAQNSSTILEAALSYQTASREYIEFVTGENRSDDWGRRLYDAREA